MLPDSMNVGVIAENIKKLEAMVQEAGSELPTPEAGDVGKILKVGSDGYKLATEYSYTPPAYSSTDEVDTGRKWINGAAVYEMTLNGTFPVIAETGTQWVTGLSSNLNILKIDGAFARTDGQTANIERFPITYQGSNGNIGIGSVPSAYSEGDYVIIITYIKPAPVPSNETKKKTSKKGE